LKGDGISDVKVPANLYNLIIVCHTTVVSVFNKKNKKNNQGVFLGWRDDIDKYNKAT
jgi:hypothetical protein